MILIKEQKHRVISHPYYYSLPIFSFFLPAYSLIIKNIMKRDKEINHIFYKAYTMIINEQKHHVTSRPYYICMYYSLPVFSFFLTAYIVYFLIASNNILCILLRILIQLLSKKFALLCSILSKYKSRDILQLRDRGQLK